MQWPSPRTSWNLKAVSREIWKLSFELSNIVKICETDKKASNLWPTCKQRKLASWVQHNKEEGGEQENEDDEIGDRGGDYGPCTSVFEDASGRTEWVLDAAVLLKQVGLQQAKVTDFRDLGIVTDFHPISPTTNNRGLVHNGPLLCGQGSTWSLIVGVYDTEDSKLARNV